MIAVASVRGNLQKEKSHDLKIAVASLVILMFFYWFSTHGFFCNASRDTLELLRCDYRALNHSAARDGVM